MQVSRTQIAFELIGFGIRRRNFVLVPLLLLIAVLSALIVFAETSVIAPFLYPFF